jgi:polysaccharide biosynthesis/export protein
MTRIIRLHYILLLFLGLFFSTICLAQPGVPYSSNPYSTNPYGATSKAKKKKIEEEKKKALDEKKSESNTDNKPDIKPEDDVIDRDISDNNPKDESDDLLNEFGFYKSKKDSIEATKIKIYGMDFFKNNSFRNSDKAVITPPPSYRIGAGDEIIVNLWGKAELQEKYIVGRDGTIFPNGIGRIYVQGLQYENARTVIANKFRNNIASGSNIDVQMGVIRTIKVSIIGEVVKQGTVTISAFNTAFNALSLAGGVTDLGNLRDIQIKRNNSVAYSIDLYEFIKTGGNIEDVYLEDGDIIFVGQYEKLVEAVGSFRRPMYYQLKADEALNNLIDLAGGPTADARASSVSIKSIADEKMQMITINLRDLDKESETFSLQDGDVVVLNKIIAEVNNTVRIKGAVQYESDYQLKPGERIMDVLKKAGGLKPNAFTSKAFVIRHNKLAESRTIKIDLTEVTESDFSKNIEIFAKDTIIIISKDIFKNNYVIDVIGQVRSPGSILYSEGMSIKDVIMLTGGLTMDAEDARVEIASIIDSFDTYNLNIKNNAVSKTYSINKNLEVEDASSEVILKPYDKIYVRKKPNFKLMENITLSGAVKYPGSYPLLSSTEKFSSVVARAGGFIEGASPSDARLTRALVGKIIINLSNAVNNPNGKSDMILQNGDVLDIPLVNDIVGITGQVLEPINMKYESDSNSIKYYVNSAGGFSKNPWKDRISVKYANGRNVTTKRIFFVRKYPKVRPGCLITVPEKPEKPEGSGLKLADLTALTGSIISSLSVLISAWAILQQ